MNGFELAPLILKLIIILAAARFAGIVAVKMRLPTVLGELLAGVALGPSIYNYIHNGSEPVLSFLAEIGVILMLFEVGLGSDIKDIMKKGRAASLVGLIGTIVPFGLGFLYFMSLGMGFITSILIGAILSATSVGITMRVFFELNKVKTEEAKIILGAAIIDDILGLILLSVIVGLIETGAVSILGTAKIVLYAIIFFGATLIVGINLIPPIYKIVDALKIKRTFLISEFLLALSLALIANRIGLATIMGAFAAGLILERTKYRRVITKRIHPLSRVFVPIFFVMAGSNLNIWTIFQPGAIRLIFFLFAIAVIGKLVSGIGAFGTKASKFAVGIGMIPRGEVALIVASFGLSYGLITGQLYSVVVVMIMLTAIIVPPSLRPFIK